MRWGWKVNPVMQEWLNFDLRPNTVMEELGAMPDEIKRVVLVGHEPTFSGMVAWLLGAETGYVEMKKASAVLFELDASFASRGAAEDASPGEGSFVEKR